MGRIDAEGIWGCLQELGEKQATYGDAVRLAVRLKRERDTVAAQAADARADMAAMRALVDASVALMEEARDFARELRRRHYEEPWSAEKDTEDLLIYPWLCEEKATDPS